MAHLEGSERKDDPKEYGMKFDAGKPRWGLLPIDQLKRIIYSANFYMPPMTTLGYPVSLLEFDRDVIINSITDKIMAWLQGFRFQSGSGNYENLALSAFEMFYLLRGKPYTLDELKGTPKNSTYKWNLFDMVDIEGVVDVYTLGAKKYADNNWQKIDRQRYGDALMRHFKTIRTPARYDEELGCLHSYQVIWNCMTLMWMDDRDEKGFSMCPDLIGRGNTLIPKEIIKTSKMVGKLSSGVTVKKKTSKKKVVKKKMIKKKAVKKKVVKKKS